VIDVILANQTAVWIGLGFLLLAIEALAFGFSSGVLLFGSLGAIATGALLWFGLIPDTFIAAMASFAISTAAVTALLWLPLKRLQSGAELGNDRSSDIIGHTFNLSSDINRTTWSEQKYSGIKWSVKPAEDLADDAISAGTHVQVTAVSVGAFFVKPVLK
jgi:membrane protein implicated in regulation of membrane protease activity